MEKMNRQSQWAYLNDNTTTKIVAALSEPELKIDGDIIVWHFSKRGYSPTNLGKMNPEVQDIYNLVQNPKAAEAIKNIIIKFSMKIDQSKKVKALSLLYKD